jgi:hypothetical protein
MRARSPWRIVESSRMQPHARRKAMKLLQPRRREIVAEQVAPPATGPAMGLKQLVNTDPHLHRNVTFSWTGCAPMCVGCRAEAGAAVENVAPWEDCDVFTTMPVGAA